VPEPMLLYNVAVCYERMGQRVDAIEHYDRYLREEPEADNAADVRRRVERLHAERVAAQEEPAEVEAVDEQSIADRVPHTALQTAHHEVGLFLGTSLALEGVRDAGDASFDVGLGYHYRVTHAWHIGAGLLLDWYGEQGSDLQSQYGAFVGGRWGFQPIPVLEVRFEFQAAYQYLDYHTSAIGYGSGHFAFVRAGPTVAWDIWRGFGLMFLLDARLGYYQRADGETSGFAGSLDILLGAFWAFGGSADEGGPEGE